MDWKMINGVVWFGFLRTEEPYKKGLFAKYVVASISCFFLSTKISRIWQKCGWGTWSGGKTWLWLHKNLTEAEAMVWFGF
jgi:hypothetical protein